MWVKMMKIAKPFFASGSAVAGALLTLLLVHCAQQIPPTGGPDDTTPPRIRESTPPQGATAVSTQTRIQLVFSEWITPTGIEDAVTLFPPPDGGIDVSVSGRKLMVGPESPLLDSTTYHLGINTSLTDIRGVPIGRPVTIVFSTGSTLDSAEVEGCIVAPDPETAQPKVGLYRVTEQWHDTLLLSMPSYLTQSDSAGRFSFDFIRPDTYRLVGFVDTDRNNRLTPGREKGYMPMESLVIVDTSRGPLPLFPAATDTATVRIVTRSLAVRSPTVIAGRWSGTPVPPTPQTDTSWRILSAEGAAPSIETYVALGNNAFLLLLSSPLQNRAYTLVYPLLYPLFSPEEHDTARPSHDSLRFNGTAFPDTTAPSIMARLPRGVAGLDPRLSFVWSEPVRALADTAMLVDTLGDTVMLWIDAEISDTTHLVPQTTLRPGRLYRVSIPPEEFVDLAGNAPRDTTDTFTVQISLQTISADSLCYLMSGGAPCLSPAPSRMWRYTPFTGNPVLSTDSSGLFSFDSIPASKGTIGFFEDTNEDLVPNDGRLFPWEAPELHITYADTVEARARWEITGLSFPDCRICPPAPDTIQTDTAEVDTGTTIRDETPQR
jgi:hypothetical protein